MLRVIIRAPSSTTTTTKTIQPPPQDKGKEIIIEEPVVKPLLRETQMNHDTEVVEALAVEFAEENKIVAE